MMISSVAEGATDSSALAGCVSAGAACSGCAAGTTDYYTGW